MVKKMSRESTKLEERTIRNVNKKNGKKLEKKKLKKETK